MSYRIKLLALLFSIFSVIEILALQVVSIASHSRLRTPFNLGCAVRYLWGWPFSCVDSDPFPLSSGSSHEGFLVTLTDVSLDKNLFEGKTAATTINLQEHEHSESAQPQTLQKQSWKGMLPTSALMFFLLMVLIGPPSPQWTLAASMLTSKTLLCICSDINMQTFSLIYFLLIVLSK